MDSTEVVDLKSGKIFSMAPLGRRTFGATGGLLDGLPVICGGSNDKIHSIAKDQSKFLGQLSVRRNHAASVVLSNNTLWVTGGFDQSGNSIKTTEIVTKDGQTSQGPDLPLALSSHAIVPLNSGAFILIGGNGNPYGVFENSATHFYEKKGWRPGPNLKKGRDGHTAGVLTDRVSTIKYIVAVGGHGADSSLEYLEYPGSSEWMKGKPTHSSLDQLQLESHLCKYVLGTDLPKPLQSHGMVNYGTDLVVMGGYSSGSRSSSFYQLSVENGIFKWEKMKPELKIPRSDFVAMTIPDHLVDTKY